MKWLNTVFKVMSVSVVFIFVGVLVAQLVRVTVNRFVALWGADVTLFLIFLVLLALVVGVLMDSWRDVEL